MIEDTIIKLRWFRNGKNLDAFIFKMNGRSEYFLHVDGSTVMKLDNKKTTALKMCRAFAKGLKLDEHMEEIGR